jgi:hypothetical protein
LVLGSNPSGPTISPFEDGAMRDPATRGATVDPRRSAWDWIVSRRSARRLRARRGRLHVDVRMEARGAVCSARAVATARERVPKPSIAEEIVRVFYVLQMRSIHEQE